MNENFILDLRSGIVNTLDGVEINYNDLTVGHVLEIVGQKFKVISNKGYLEIYPLSGQCLEEGYDLPWDRLVTELKGFLGFLVKNDGQCPILTIKNSSLPQPISVECRFNWGAITASADPRSWFWSAKLDYPKSV